MIALAFAFFVTALLYAIAGFGGGLLAIVALAVPLFATSSLLNRISASLILGLVGIDVNSGAQRFTFGITELLDGIGFIAVAVGVFAITEIVTNLEKKETREVASFAMPA